MTAASLFGEVRFSGFGCGKQIPLTARRHYCHNMSHIEVSDFCFRHRHIKADDWNFLAVKLE